MKKYILIFLVTIIAVHFSTAALLSYRYWVARDLSDADERVGQITKYQEQKIAAMQPGEIDTVFLGDSSLGNAINAKLFDRLSGAKSLNLALTGSHGHPGALIFLRKITAKQPSLRNVVLFFSVDGMAMGMDLDARFYMSPSPFEPHFSLARQAALLRTYALRLTDGVAAFSYIKKVMDGHAQVEIPHSVYEDDYTISRGKIAADYDNIHSYKMPKDSLPKSVQYLREIGVICKEFKLRCVYVQGPILGKFITGDAAEEHYFYAVGEQIQRAGIVSVNSHPYPMSQKEVGDSIFHLSQEYRDAYTTRYEKLLATLLDIPPR